MKKSNQEESRQHNRRLVLNTIYHRGEISRVEIARQTQLTRTTVSEIVAEFIDSGLVIETGQAPSRGGKPATLLQVDENSRLLVGVDLAESQFCGALINLRGEIVERGCLLLESTSGDTAIEAVYTLIEELLNLADSVVIGIGVGVPGLMDPLNGTVRQAVNLDWRNLPLGQILEARFQRPIYLANDCQVSALGEYTFGTPTEGQNLILIKAGRGVGAGIVINGQLFHGEGAGAGEIGHIQIQTDGAICRCGNRGCLETVASTRALVQQSPTPIDNYESLLRAYHARDPQVLALIDVAGYALGETIKHMVSILNIQEIRIAGNLSQFGEAILTPIRKDLQHGVLPALAAQTQVELASLGDDIVLLGAASLVLKNELGLL
jgi:predicted NBD/HSP70 family sugar kinase